METLAKNGLNISKKKAKQNKKQKSNRHIKTKTPNYCQCAAIV